MEHCLLQGVQHSCWEPYDQVQLPGPLLGLQSPPWASGDSNLAAWSHAFLLWGKDSFKGYLVLYMYLYICVYMYLTYIFAI